MEADKEIVVICDNAFPGSHFDLLKKIDFSRKIEGICARRVDECGRTTASHAHVLMLKVRKKSNAL